jgi:hypothetical protein
MARGKSGENLNHCKEKFLVPMCAVFHMASELIPSSFSKVLNL